jgi:hypothetical protein
MKPTAEAQVQFLTQIQRLLTEGQFVATYKYALLLAQADLAVELGDDSGESMLIQTHWIAEKFVEYYWRHSIPYMPRGGSGDILQQNTGRQAEVIAHLQKIRGAQPSLVSVRQDRPTWNEIIRKVDLVVRKMPL